MNPILRSCFNSRGIRNLPSFQDNLQISYEARDNLDKSNKIIILQKISSSVHQIILTNKS